MKPKLALVSMVAAAALAVAPATSASAREWRHGNVHYEQHHDRDNSGFLLGLAALTGVAVALSAAPPPAPVYAAPVYAPPVYAAPVYTAYPVLVAHPIYRYVRPHRHVVYAYPAYGYAPYGYVVRR